MDKLVIEGGEPLSGTVVIPGAKNAALPILAAALLAEGQFSLHSIPNLKDIDVMLELLRELGCIVEREGHVVHVDTTDVTQNFIHEDQMMLMRSTVFLAGPLLARFGEVTIYQPGGCAIGERKIDLHLQGFQSLGAHIIYDGHAIHCSATTLIGADIHLPFASVGATENIMMAAVFAEGLTTITNAAREPEIQDLQRFLCAMGARIMGAGTDTIYIEGVSQLSPCHYRVIPDRITTGTFMMAAAVTQGSATLVQTNANHLSSLIHLMRRSGIQIVVQNDIIKVIQCNRWRAVPRVVTAPYPAFPTDLQAQLMVLLTLANGVSIIEETVFENRLKHVGELARMGASIHVEDNVATVYGVSRLYGATVEATDLRAGAALIMAGLAAHGKTVVEQVCHVDRGYESIENTLQQLGARIMRVTQETLVSL